MFVKSLITWEISSSSCFIALAVNHEKLIFLRFKSDGSEAFSGFRLEYSILDG